MMGLFSLLETTGVTLLGPVLAALPKPLQRVRIGPLAATETYSARDWAITNALSFYFATVFYIVNYKFLMGTWGREPLYLLLVRWRSSLDRVRVRISLLQCVAGRPTSRLGTSKTILGWPQTEKCRRARPPSQRRTSFHRRISYKRTDDSVQAAPLLLATPSRGRFPR